MWIFFVVIVAGAIIYFWKSGKFSSGNNSSGSATDSIDWDSYNKLIAQANVWLEERELLPFDVIGIKVAQTSYAPGSISVGFNAQYSSMSLWKNYPYPDPKGRPGNEDLAKACDETMGKVNTLFTKHPFESDDVFSYESKPIGTYKKSSANKVKTQIEEYNKQHFPELTIYVYSL